MKTERISLIIYTVTKHPNVISAEFTLKHIFVNLLICLQEKSMIIHFFFPKKIF